MSLNYNYKMINLNKLIFDSNLDDLGMHLIQLDPFITQNNTDNLLFDYSNNFTKRNNLY